MANARRRFIQADTLWAWRRAVLRSDLPPKARYLLLVLACRMRDDPAPVYTAIRNLTADTGWNTDTVRTVLRAVVEAGWLKVAEIEPGHLQISRQS